MTSRRSRNGPRLMVAMLALFAAQVKGQVPPSAGALTEGLDPRRNLSIPEPAEFLFPGDGPSPSTHDKNGRRFLVKGFRFVGNTVFTEARLRRLVERYTDLQLNLYDLNKAADRVTRFYRDLGFPVSSAFVPVQKVENGVVLIQVVEGRIGQVDFDGGRRYSDEFLAGYLAPLREQPVVGIGQMERSLLLLNDLPGLSARATLAPGSQQGETDLGVALSERPVVFTVQANNWGRKEAGANRLDMGVEINNPLGIGDQLVLRAMKSSQDLMRFSKVGYSLPLGKDGWRLTAGATTVNYKVAGSFAPLAIEGLVNSRELGLSYPLRRSRASNILLTMGVKSIQTDQSALGVPVLNSRLTVGSTGISANWVHSDSSSTSASALLSSNFRKSNSADPTALAGKLEMDFSHLMGLSPRWDLFTRFNATTSAGSVPDTEKFSLGGPDSVRGYRVAEYRGDKGYLMTAEFRRQYQVAGIVGVFSLFHDRGIVRNAGFAGQDGLASWGVGTTVFTGKDSRLRADMAWPSSPGTPAAGSERYKPRLWLSASISF